MKQQDILTALLVVLIWGANFTVIRLGLEGMPPMLLAALRFVLAALPAVFFVPRPAVAVRYWVAYGLFVGFGQFGCLFYAMHLGMPAGVASVVLQSQVFFTFVFAGVLLREAITIRQLAGLGVAAAGLYLVGGVSGSSGTIDGGPLLLTLAAGACWGMSNIVVRKAYASAVSCGVRFDIFSLVVWSALVPPIPLFALSFMIDSPATILRSLASVNSLSIFSIIYLAFAATLFGYGAWSRLLARYSANRVAPLSLLVPVAGLVTARIVLDERLTAWQWGGCLLVVAGLCLATLRMSVRPARAGIEQRHGTTIETPLSEPLLKD